MSPHVGARLHGHGMIVLPLPGFRIERAEGELVLRVERAGASGIVDLRSGPVESDLCHVSPGTRQGGWRIETSELACAWPEGFALTYDPEAMSPFLLLGPDESMIWVNGPLEAERAMPIEKLAAPGQRVREVAEALPASAWGAAARIDLEYEEQGERWWQRRYVIERGDLAGSDGSAIVLTAQARSALEPLARAAIELVETTLEPARPSAVR